VRVFLGVFLLCLAVGEGINYSRQAVYRSAATVLTVAPPKLDTPTHAGDVDVQHVAIQQQLLLSEPLMDETLARLQKDGEAKRFAIASVDDFRSSLAVSPVASTHLVKLSAEGPRSDLLAVLVNAWIKAYLDYREAAVRRELGQTMDALKDRLKELKARIDTARQALASYRDDNGILSDGRADNPAQARLQGLNKALNDARARQVQAAARLQTLEEAVQRGEEMVPDQDKADLVKLKVDAAEMRDKLKSYRKRYTQQYALVNPEFESLPKQLEALELRIRHKVEQGRQLLLTQAREDLRTAETEVRNLERQLHDNRAEAADFTARYAKYDAMSKDLASLEELNRETEVRRADLPSRSLQKYPQVEVVDWASTPLTPLYPDYTRDALWILVGALTLGVFAVWLVEYLRRTPEAEATSRPGALAGIRIFTDTAPAVMGETAPRLGTAGDGPALSAPLPRELARPEIATLWESADNRGRRLLGLLLAGLNLEEAARAVRADLDAGTGLLAVAGSGAREVALDPAVADFLEDEPEDARDLEAELQLLAHDAGLAFPDQVDAAALRHTYVLYLVRQGARLRELDRVMGPLPARLLTAYAPYSPKGGGKPLSDLELLYPLPQ
jgi:uncharacterized protein involved in exopolysaccharide biosynthesis